MCKQMTDIKLSVLQHLKPFNCVQTIVILVYEQISSIFSKNKIIDKLFTHEVYMHSHLNVQTNDWY